MKWIIAPVVFTVFAMLVASARADQARGLTVVELYTSQGCSSCPAADKFLTELARRDDVLALSLHVDYWNYIGWKDPFSSPVFTARQRAYAPNFDLRYVYTPQMVIHGADQAVGSDRSTVGDMIDRHNHLPRVAVAAAATLDGALTIRLPKSTLDKPARLWIATFDSSHTTEIRRGENEGTTLTNVNVVRNFVPLGRWDGTPKTVTVSARDMADYNGDGVAVVVQADNRGPILGAARVALK